jgi:hypothetical protein
MDMFFIAFVVVSFCMVVLLPLALIAEIIVHLYEIFFVVSLLVLAIVLIVQIRLFIKAVAGKRISVGILSALAVICGGLLIPIIWCPCLDSYKHHAANAFLVVWLVIGALTLVAWMTHATIKYDIHASLLFALVICLMGFAVFWGLWSIAYHEANLGKQNASVAYLTEYATNSKFDLYQDCGTNLNKN